MSSLQGRMVDYLRDQVIAALTHWLQAQAWRAFDILGWGGIAALIAGCFLIAAVFTRLSKSLARPVPMVIAASIISLGLVVMVGGWMKPKPSRPLLASTAPSRTLPVIVPPVAFDAFGDLADNGTLAPSPALPLHVVPPVLTLPSLPLAHHEALPAHHATAHAQVEHSAMPVAHAPAAEHPASPAHTGHAASAAVAHQANAAKSGVTASSETLAGPSHASGSGSEAQADASAKPAKPARPTKGDIGVASGGGSTATPHTPSPSAVARANAAAARRAFNLQQDRWVLENYGAAMRGAMGGYYGGGHGSHPAMGGHPPGGHPAASHPAGSHHTGGHR